MKFTLKERRLSFPSLVNDGEIPVVVGTTVLDLFSVMAPPTIQKYSYK